MLIVYLIIFTLFTALQLLILYHYLQFIYNEQFTAIIRIRIFSSTNVLNLNNSKESENKT